MDNKTAERARNEYTRQRLKRENRKRILVDLPKNTIDKLTAKAKAGGIARKNLIEKVLNESVGE